MSQQLSSKTWFIVLANGLVKNVTEDEARQTKQGFMGGLEAFELGDGTLIPRSGTTICSNADFDVMEHKKRGDWQCKYLTWHSRKEATYDCMCGRSH